MTHMSFTAVAGDRHATRMQQTGSFSRQYQTNSTARACHGRSGGSDIHCSPIPISDFTARQIRRHRQPASV